MKIVFLLLLIPIFGYSQSNMLITLEGQTNVLNGLVHTEVFIPSTSNYSGEIISIHFNITNLTGVDQECTITQRRIERPTNWFESLMWNIHVNPSSDLYEIPNTLGNPTFTIINGTNQTTDGNVAQLGVFLHMSASATNHALYRYYITNAQTHEYIDSVDLEINALLGVDELESSSMNMYPNPSSGQVNISFDGEIQEKISIYNLEGKCLLMEYLDINKTFDLSPLDNGTYIVEFYCLSGIIRKKIMIED